MGKREQAPIPAEGKQSVPEGPGAPPNVVIATSCCSGQQGTVEHPPPRHRGPLGPSAPFRHLQSKSQQPHLVDFQALFPPLKVAEGTRPSVHPQSQW